VSVADQFGANLKRCRRLAGLSQEKAAIRASLHRTEISQLERGLHVPRIDTLVKLMGALETSADDLLTGIEWCRGRCTLAASRYPRGRYPLAMPKRSSKPRDVNSLARLIVDEATGQKPVAEPEGEPKPDPGKDPAAVALGRRGGKKGGKARAEKMTPEERSEAARRAAKARWKAR
jgi:transcriptional regulator with XRE-family HTH domain